MRRRGGTQRLGEILASLMQRRDYARPLALAAYRTAWAKSAGERIASRSRVASVRHGVLTIEVSSAAQRYELEAFHRPELLAALGKDDSIEPVVKLVFRVGHVAT